jgi:hypothetical protein
MARRRWVSVWLCMVALGVPAMAADLGLGLRAGTQGLGLEFGAALTPWFGLRGGAYGFDVSDTYDNGDLSYDGTFKLGGYGVLADFYPMKGTFRLTVGILDNRNGAEIEAVPTAPVDIGNGTYDPSQVGKLSGDLTFKSTVPYFGLGWGNVARGHRVGFLCDLGVVKQGSGKVTLASSTGLVSEADLAAEAASIEDDIKDFDFWPVISFGLAIRI